MLKISENLTPDPGRLKTIFYFDISSGVTSNKQMCMPQSSPYWSPQNVVKKSSSPLTAGRLPVCHAVDLAHWIWQTWMVGASYC